MSELMFAVVASAVAIGALAFYAGNGVLSARRSSSRPARILAAAGR